MLTMTRSVCCVSLFLKYTSLSAGFHDVQDVAVDILTGDIIFIGDNILYKMVIGGRGVALHSDFAPIQSLAVDHTNR